jgi:hypothetical protein
MELCRGRNSQVLSLPEEQPENSRRAWVDRWRLTFPLMALHLAVVLRKEFQLLSEEVTTHLVCDSELGTV